MAAVSLAIMAGLVLARIMSERRRRRIEAERKRMMPFLLGGGEGGREAVARSSLAGPLLTDLSVELIQLVRGDDRAAFVDLASRSGVAASLQRRVGSGSARARATAAESLGAFLDEGSTLALSRALDDPSPDVRLAAAMSLADSGRAPPATELVERLGLGVRENSMLIVSLFQKIAADRPEEIKALVLDPAVPTPVKAAAIDALSASGDYGLVPAINDLALATEEKSEDLPRFLRALGSFGHPAGAPAVRRGLSASTWWVRAAAAEAAGRIGLGDCAPKLAAMLGDGDWWVRFRAGEALVRLGKTGRELLADASRSGSDAVRTAARLTLAEQGLPS